MRRASNSVTVKAKTKIECQTRTDGPLIAGEPGDFILMDGIIGGSAKLDPLQGRAVDSHNIHGLKLLVAVIGAVREVEAHLQLMGSVEMPGGELIYLLPLHAVGVAILPVEESAFCGLDQQTVRL